MEPLIISGHCLTGLILSAESSSAPVTCRTGSPRHPRLSGMRTGSRRPADTPDESALMRQHRGGTRPGSGWTETFLILTGVLRAQTEPVWKQRIITPLVLHVGEALLLCHRSCSLTFCPPDMFPVSRQKTSYTENTDVSDTGSCKTG